MSIADETGRPAATYRINWPVRILGLCCVGFVFTQFFSLGFVHYVSYQMADRIESDFRDHPTIHEHLGKLLDVKPKDSDAPFTSDGKVFHYKLVGSDRDGELAVDYATGPMWNATIRSATLLLPGGQRIPIESLPDVKVR